MARAVNLHLRLDNGSFLCARNMHRIVCRCTFPTDRSGNPLVDLKGQPRESPIWEHRGEPPVFRTYFVRKEKQGYIFRQANGQPGLGGWQKSIREIVIRALMLKGFVVEVLDPSEVA